MGIVLLLAISIRRYLDQSLAADQAIVFNAGTHHDAIRMRYDDFVRLVKPQICSFA
jgi:Ala-tRNA(Pro) deacylase